MDVWGKRRVRVEGQEERGEEEHGKILNGAVSIGNNGGTTTLNGTATVTTLNASSATSGIGIGNNATSGTLSFGNNSAFAGNIAIGAGSLTRGGTINIGTGGTGTISIGNGIAPLILSGSTIRYVYTPVISYSFSGTQFQTIVNGTDTIIKFPSAETMNGTGTGITYSVSTGKFTNSNSYSVTITACASISYALYNNGIRTIVLVHSGLGRIGMVNLYANALDATGLSTSASFVLAPTETIHVETYQNSGISVNVGNSSLGANRISLLVM